MLKVMTNPMLVQDPDSPTGVNDCTRVRTELTTGQTHLHDSGGGMFAFTRALPIPYDYISEDPLSAPLQSSRSARGAMPGGGLTPIPIQPKPILIGVVVSTNNTGVQAYLHDVFEPGLTCECYRPGPFDPGPCLLDPFDLNRDYVHDETDLALARTIWLGPCGATTFPSDDLCFRLDVPGGGVWWQHERRTG